MSAQRKLALALRRETATLMWDPDFKHLLRPLPSNPDGARFKSRGAGLVVVDVIVDEDTLDALRDHANSSDLLNDVPNISVAFGNKISYLTWNEAYNLGQALVKMAEVSLFG